MTPQQRRRSRNENIPHNFIQNWQCPGAEGARPVVRRPITACGSCRSAKVKCTGPQNACDRCTTRGIPCRYTAPSTTSSSSSRPTTASMSPSNNVDSSGSSPNSHSPATVNTPLSGSLKSGVPMTMEWEMDPGDPLRLHDEAHHQDMNGVVDWSKDMSSYLFDWSSLDLGHNTIDPLNTLSTGELDVFPTAAQTPLLANQERSTGLATTTTPAPSTPSQGSCQCRTNLMLQVPEVHEAMQAKPHPQLDRIFKVTGNVLGACRDLIICASCQVSYADLVCVVAVLQQTGTCFEKIANGDMTTSTIKVCVGQYEVPIANEIKLRHMLVMDLVAQANCLLSLLRNRGQSLVQSQGPAQDRLTQINIDYMQEVVKSFEQTLRSIADSLDKPVPDS